MEDIQENFENQYQRTKAVFDNIGGYIKECVQPSIEWLKGKAKYLFNGIDNSKTDMGDSVQDIEDWGEDIGKDLTDWGMEVKTSFEQIEENVKELAKGVNDWGEEFSNDIKEWGVEVYGQRHKKG